MDAAKLDLKSITLARLAEARAEEGHISKTAGAIGSPGARI